MAAEDWMYDYDPDYEREVRCKFCGERDLWWGETKDGWRLFDGEQQPHICANRQDAASADEFE